MLWSEKSNKLTKKSFGLSDGLIRGDKHQLKKYYEQGLRESRQATKRKI